MRSYFDTSVLFPAMVNAHPQHIKCKQLFQDAKKQGEIICLSLHIFAELYTNLTRFPLGNKIHPQIAVESILELGKTVTTIDLVQSDYEAAMLRCANAGLISGIIYDSLHLQAAIKSRATVLYTSNLRDFKRLLTPDLSIELIGVEF